MSARVVATIDLGAISANLSAMRGHLPTGIGLLAAVKANAYGHGSEAISHHLERSEAVEMLGVATVGEAAELRRAGISLPILKLSHCLPDELPEAVGLGLALTVVDEDGLRAVSSVASGPVEVHLKLDSGMGRIGSPLAEGVRLARLARDLPHLELTGVFTHLPISDLANDDGVTAAEIGAFNQTVADISADSGPVRWVHAANSGAILGHNLDGHTLARTGIAMYGYYPDTTTPRTVPLRQALTLTSRLSYRKWVEPGTTIGYGRTWTATEPTWIGTVSIGYADGFSRLNSNRGHLVINGRRVPVVGRVCMDQTMINLGPTSPDAVGDQVIILGGDPASGPEGFIGADEVAELMGTISYEVTCMISARVERRHLGG